MIQVQVPQGVVPGMYFAVMLADGSQQQVVCPPNVNSGQTIQMQLAAPSTGVTVMNVQVPAGVGPHMPFAVKLPDGTQMQTICPQDAVEGQMIQIQLPPKPAQVEPIAPVTQVKPSGFKMVTVTIVKDQNEESVGVCLSDDSSKRFQGWPAVVVRSSESAAAAAGLREGDWVDNINGVVVKTKDHTIRLIYGSLKSSGRVAVTVIRGFTRGFEEPLHFPDLALSITAVPDLALSITAEELLCATEDLLFLLRAVPPCLLKRGPELTHALWRYEKIWLPLAAQATPDDSTVVVPPPDVAWVWLCHQLAPEHYVKDVTALCRSVPTRLPSDRQRRAPKSRPTLGAMRGLLYTDVEYAWGAKSWTAYCESHGLGAEPFWVPYVPRVTSAPVEAAPSAPDASFVSRLGYDIAAAVERQNVFNYQVRACRTHMNRVQSSVISFPSLAGEPAALHGEALPDARGDALPLLPRAAPAQPGQRGPRSRHRRHACSTDAHARSPVCSQGKFLVPTYDIDVVWHAHQLQPTYVADTTKLLGRMLNHDDSVNDRTPGEKLSNCADSTRDLWAEACVQPFHGTPPTSCHTQTYPLHDNP